MNGTHRSISFQRLTRFARAYGRDTGGVAALEFAIVAIPFFILFMAAVEFGLLFLTQIQLEGVVADAARTTIIGDTGGAANRVTYVENLIHQRAQHMIHGDKVVISEEVVNNGRGTYQEPELCLTTPPSFPSSGTCSVNYIDSNHNGRYDGGSLSHNVGNQGDLVQINVVLPWEFFTPIMGLFFQHKGEVRSPGGQTGEGPAYGAYIIRTGALVKNEPFGNKP